MSKNLFVFALLVVLAATQSQRLDSGVNFDGEWTPSFDYYPTARFVISGNQIRLEGVCYSDMKATFEASTSGAIKFSPLTGTHRSCFLNYDSFYVNALKAAASWEVQGEKLIFKNNQGRRTVFLTKAKAPSGNLISFAGKYQTQSKGYFIDITDTEVILSGGCRMSSPYRAYTDGTFLLEQFGGDVASCSDDDDAFGINLSSSTHYVINKDSSITFKRNGGVTTKLKPVGSGNPAPKISTVNQQTNQRFAEKPVDKCANIRCPAGSSCRGGQCFRVPAANNNVNNNKCLNVRCQAGARCENGKCVPDIQNFESAQILPFDYENGQSNNWGQFAQANDPQFGRNQKFNF